MFKRFFKSLYWKISALLLVLFAIIGGIYIYVTLFTAEMYLQEAEQRVNTPVATRIAKLVEPLIGKSVSKDSLRSIFHEASSLNPGLEVHLLDPNGLILATSVTHALKFNRVPLNHIQQFIQGSGKTFVLGEDPCGLVEEKVFSAAPILHNGELLGYIYIVLHGKEYDSLAERLVDSYILRLGARSLIVTLLSAAFVALVVLAFLMKKLRSMTLAVKSFEQGKYDSRVNISSNDEIAQLAQAFNSMADTIVKHLDELKQVDIQRRELVANISHDLKTPITSIQGYVETLLLKGTSLSDEERLRYLQIILSGTERLRKLVEQILELSKLEAGHTLPQPELFSVGELVQDVVQKFQPQAEKQKIRLRTIFPTDIPLVYADIGLIERAIQNLLDNALRYTPEIGVVTVQLESQEQTVEVRISDTGHGIPEENIPHIFDRFYRAEKSRSTDLGGTGLGLAIAQKIVEAHGSSITVESTVNSGTTFAFQLPLSKKG